MMPLQATDAFDEQIERPFWQAILDWVSHRCRKLLKLKDAVDDNSFAGQHDLGLQVVLVERIVGTIGREDDFDSAFRPRRRESRQRWISVFQAWSAGKALPPVELFKVGDAYFVEDGHHRISVARANAQIYIDAHVIEVDATADLRPACDR